MIEKRKIKNKERKKAGNIYCCFCKPEKVDAIYRSRYGRLNYKNDLACEEHKELIREPKPERHKTEADYYIEDRFGI